jgi:hypothetical protein
MNSLIQVTIAELRLRDVIHSSVHREKFSMGSQVGLQEVGAESVHEAEGKTPDS